MTSKPTNNSETPNAKQNGNAVGNEKQQLGKGAAPVNGGDAGTSASASRAAVGANGSAAFPTDKGHAASASAPTATEPAPEYAAAAQGETLIRKKKRHKHAKKHKGLRRAVIVLAALLALVLAAALAVLALTKMGEQSVKDANTATDVQSEGVAYDEGHTVEYNGKLYALNENMASIAIIGYDRRSEQVVPGKNVGQADAVMVLAANLDTGKVTAIGIPRDSMVEVGEFMGSEFTGMSTMQLCLAFAYGDGGETSSQYTTAAVSRVLYNMPVNNYVSLDMDSVGELANAVGGVPVTPLQSIPGTNIVKGQDTVLFGSNALKYIQWRDTSVLNSSLDRQARQSQFVQAFCKEAFAQAKGNVGTLVNLFNMARSNGVTNLGVDDFTYLASTVLNTGITGVDVTTLQGEMQQGKKFAEFYLDKTNVYETVLSVYYHEIGDAPAASDGSNGNTGN